MPCGGATKCRGFFIFIMNIIDEKLVKVFLSFTIKEITIGKAVEKVKKICSKAHHRQKCDCSRPVAEEIRPTTCLKCHGWISMAKYPYKLV